MDTQRYDELLENGTITQDEYDKLTAEPSAEQHDNPDTGAEEQPKPKTGSFFSDYVHNLNGDDLND